MVARTRFLVVVLMVAILGAYGMFQASPLRGQGNWNATGSTGLFGAFSYYGAVTYWFAGPLVAGVVASGSLAADRALRYPSLVLVRGLSRPWYLLAKATAMAVAAGLANFVSCVLVFAAASFFYPWGPLELSGAFGPFPKLFAGQPLVHDLLMAGLLSLAAASLALRGLVAGAVVANEYVSAAIPFVLVLGSAFVLEGKMALISPYTYLDLVGTYPSQLPPVSWPLAAPVYWLAFGVAAIVAGGAIFLRKEPD